MVHFPDGMPPEEITAAIERDVLPARRAKIQATVGNDAISQGAREAAQPGGLARFGRGFMDLGQGVKQLYKKATGAEDAGAYSADIAAENALYEGGRRSAAGGEDPGFDFLRLGGNVVATAPAMAIPGGQALALPARAASMATQGAVTGAVQPVLEDGGDFWTQKGIQTGVGAAVAPVANEAIRAGGQFVANKIFGPAKDFISSTVAKVKGNSQNPNAVLNPDGSLTSMGMEALKKLGMSIDDLSTEVRGRLAQVAEDATKTGKALSPEQQIRASLIKEVTGEDATLGQVTRDFTQQQTEQELKKSNSVGTPLRARFAKQNKGLLDAVEGVKRDAGGVLETEYQAGGKVAESVKGADKEAREAVSSLYKAIDQEHGGQFAIKPKGLLGKLDEISDNAESDAIVDSVKRRLSRIGLLNDAGNIKRGASLDAKNAEELRKFIGGLSGDTPSKRRMLSQLVETLDDDVRASAGEDVYEIARQVAKTRFEDLRIPAVRAIVDGDVPAEQVFDKYVRRGGIDDLKALKSYMSRGGEDAHGLTPAWNELRSQTIAEVFDRATRNAARDELDNVLFSGAMFKKSLFGRDGIGKDKLEVLFTPEEIAKLEKISRVAEWRIPMADVVNTSNTSSAMWNMVDRVLSALPGRPGMMLRGAGRAAKIGAQEIEDEAAAKAAMVPADTLARQAEEAASAKSAEAIRKGTNLLRAPSFFSLGAEAKSERRPR